VLERGAETYKRVLLNQQIGGRVSFPYDVFVGGNLGKNVRGLIEAMWLLVNAGNTWGRGVKEEGVGGRLQNQTRDEKPMRWWKADPPLSQIRKKKADQRLMTNERKSGVTMQPGTTGQRMEKPKTSVQGILGGRIKMADWESEGEIEESRPHSAARGIGGRTTWGNFYVNSERGKSDKKCLHQKHACDWGLKETWYKILGDIKTGRMKFQSCFGGNQKRQNGIV